MGTMTFVVVISPRNLGYSYYQGAGLLENYKLRVHLMRL